VAGALIRRVGQIMAALAVLSFAAYVAIGLMPGDPIDLAIVGDPRMTALDAERLRALHGLDRPIVARWWDCFFARCRATLAIRGCMRARSRPC